MARPTFVDIPDADVDVGSFGTEPDVFEPLRDNAAAVRVALFGVDIAEDTSTAAAFEAINNSSFSVYIPDLADYTGIARARSP